jgi:multidrug resistance efflux pump
VVIILCLYLVALWLVFSKLKLVRWGWFSGTVAVLVGAFILAVFLALFNYLTPSGKVTVAGRVVEVIPNVTGQIIAIPVKTNVPVKTGDVLFQIDPAPFQYKVAQLKASLAGAKQQAEILKSNYQQAAATAAGLAAQLKYNTQRLADIKTLSTEGANTEFKEQDTQVQYETVAAQLIAAKAAEQSSKLAMDSEIGGVNTTVAQIQAQLEDASWQLSQTTVRAPADGYVTIVALTVGDRALQASAVMSFIVENEITIIGTFSQNGFQTIKIGAPVDIVFDNDPGRIYHAKITAIAKGIGQGQVATSGMIARTNAIGGATTFPVAISIPDGMSRDSLRLGMSGNATAFAGNAGVIGLLASILVWISAYTAYL